MSETNYADPHLLQNVTNERDKAQAQAAQLAEALRELHEQIRLGISHGHITNLLWIEATVNAEEALAAYEAAR